MLLGLPKTFGHLREALGKVNECLDQRQFSKSSSLGYNKVSSEFIFLQRVLGELQGSEGHKQKFVRDAALKAKISYEGAFPFVDKHMGLSKPKKV